MRKLFLLMGVAAVAMTSCSNDEELSVNMGEGISFRTAMGTRGTETTTSNLDKFTVTALSGTETYFGGVEFVSDGQANPTYASDIKYYWPVDNSELNFYAWANAGSASVEINGTGQNIVDFKVAKEVVNQSDVVVTNATGSKGTPPNGGVLLTFKHALSQIAVKVKNTNASSQYVVNINSVKINKVNSKASLPINYDNDVEPTNSSELASYEVGKSYILQPGTTDAETLMDNAMLIPQQLTGWDRSEDKTNNGNGAYISLKVDINTKAGANVYPDASSTDTYAWIAVPISDKWVRNTKYVYTLDFANGAGFVDPNGKDGEEDTGDDNDKNPGPGDEVIDTDSDNEIKFVEVSVDKWEDYTEGIDKDMKTENNN